MQTPVSTTSDIPPRTPSRVSAPRGHPAEPHFLFAGLALLRNCAGVMQVLPNASTAPKKGAQLAAAPPPQRSQHGADKLRRLCFAGVLRKRRSHGRRGGAGGLGTLQRASPKRHLGSAGASIFPIHTAGSLILRWSHSRFPQNVVKYLCLISHLVFPEPSQQQRREPAITQDISTFPHSV